MPISEITGRNVARLEPDPTAASAARAWFRQEGFEVSAVIANSFSVSGDVQTFERLDPNATQATNQGWELSKDRLPDELQQVIEAITFTPGEALS